jgi:hypothetical protein
MPKKARKSTLEKRWAKEIKEKKSALVEVDPHRLWQCNPKIRVKEGSAGSVALYILKHPSEVETAEQIGEQRPKDDFFIFHKYVGGFEKKPMPEWSHVTLDTSGLPVREVRGWRSVLMRLIKSRVIAYRSAVEQFGNPETDQRSGRWFEQLAKFKNMREESNGIG